MTSWCGARAKKEDKIKKFVSCARAIHDLAVLPPPVRGLGTFPSCTCVTADEAAAASGARLAHTSCTRPVLPAASWRQWGQTLGSGRTGLRLVFSSFKHSDILLLCDTGTKENGSSQKQVVCVEFLRQMSQSWFSPQTGTLSFLANVQNNRPPQFQSLASRQSVPVCPYLAVREERLWL